MRNQTNVSKGRWGDLPRNLQQVPAFPQTWTPRNLEIFLEVEAILHLYELLIPESASRSALDAWELVSGYIIAGVNDQPEQQRMCLLLRQRLSYIKTGSAWQWWFRWYREQPQAIRLYKVEQKVGDAVDFRQQIYGSALREERLTAYERLIMAETISGSESTEIHWARAGHYHYSIDGQAFDIRFNEAIASFADTPTPSRNVHPRFERSLLRIELEELLETAQELDAREGQLDLAKRGNWYERLAKVHFAITPPSGDLDYSGSLDLDGLFHLVGALGVGKSSLIWVLTYHLVSKQGKHVTVMLNTVVETIQMAVWLRRLGIAAAPALGKNRAEHQRKYGFANADALRFESVMKLDAPGDPLLAWMPTPCALSGAATIAIPVGKEPCDGLYDDAGEAHTCPLLPACPVHAVKRDLVESQVWIVNPMSLLYTSAPVGLGDKKMSLLDAVYHTSDVVIIDEADRVQVQWDRAFAPTSPIAGSDEALLDLLHPRISRASVGRQGRHRAAESAFQRLTTTDSQAHLLASRAFQLLDYSPKLRNWVERTQLTNPVLFNKLLRELVAHAKAELDLAGCTDLKQQLNDEFRRYWHSPLHREGGIFADWLNRLLATDENNRMLRRDLSRKLAGLMGWRGKFDAERALFVLKLDFCITLTAMLKRGTDLLYQLKWIEDETQQLKTSNYEIRESLTELVPPSPLGGLLSIRWIQRKALNDLGVFNMLRYQGVGRWLLLNLPCLHQARSGALGPHVLLTSATSWLPGSAQFHLASPPQAVLCFRPEFAEQSSHIDLYFRGVQEQGRLLPVSGAGEAKERHLRQIVRDIATQGDLQAELDHWRRRGEDRRVLLVVNSYAQTAWVLDELEQLDDWKDRAICLLPDDADLPDYAAIRAREVEQFSDRDADILIAPLLAIQRGFNILDEQETALLGTVYFLVRPYPPPDDLDTQILSLNRWLLKSA